MAEVLRNFLKDFFSYPLTIIQFKKKSVPEHLKHLFMVQSISIIHKDEAIVSSDTSLINPDMRGTHIWIIGIVYQMKQYFG